VTWLAQSALVARPADRSTGRSSGRASHRAAPAPAIMNSISGG
jgi:hypothetical protein